MILNEKCFNFSVNKTEQFFCSTITSGKNEIMYKSLGTLKEQTDFFLSDIFPPGAEEYPNCIIDHIAFEKIAMHFGR